MYSGPKNFEYFTIFKSLNQKWPKSDFFGLKLILSTFNENFKKDSLESVETFFASQKKYSDVLLTKKFQILFNILKFGSKVA